MIIDVSALKEHLVLDVIRRPGLVLLIPVKTENVVKFPRLRDTFNANVVQAGRESFAMFRHVTLRDVKMEVPHVHLLNILVQLVRATALTDLKAIFAKFQHYARLETLARKEDACQKQDWILFVTAMKVGRDSFVINLETHVKITLVKMKPIVELTRKESQSVTVKTVGLENSVKLILTNVQHIDLVKMAEFV